MRHLFRRRLAASLFALLGAASVFAQPALPDPSTATMPKPLVVPPPAPPPVYVPFPHLPAVTLDEVHNGLGVAQKTARERRVQGRLLWIDATANLDRVNTAEKIAALVRQIKAAGFNTVVFDVKPIVGHTLYPSRFAPKLTEWKKGSVVRTLPADFDPLAAFVTETRAAGLGLLVNLNAFAEGHRDFGMGPGYERPEWQTILYEEQARLRAGTATHPLSVRTNELPADAGEIAVYTNRDRLLADLSKGDGVVVLLGAAGQVLAQIAGSSFAALNAGIPASGAAFVGRESAAAEFLRRNATVGQTLALETNPGFVRIGERPRRQVPLMTNPHHPEVRRRILDMIAEVATGYAVDGVIFDDRLRFAGLDADFSEPTRRAFEEYLGVSSLRWPDDVLRYQYRFPTLERYVVPGPRFDAWLVFRALALRNWLAEAAATVKAARPGALVATYVGANYPDYPDLGANWAADDLAAGFLFLNDAYRQTGWAGLTDFIITGAYYPTATMAEAAAKGVSPGVTVEAAGQFANRAVNDQTWIYAGLSLDKFPGRPEDLKRALQAAAATTQGILIFDLSHDIEGFWPVFAEAFREPAEAPHAVPSLLAEVRRERAARKAAGIPEPPVVVYRGLPGTGL